MAIFNQLFQVKGKHADMMRDLTERLSCRNLDVFYISIVLGLAQNRAAKIDDGARIEPAKIDPEQMVRFNDDIQFFYRLVMLSDKNYCVSEKTRCDKAFRQNENEKDEEHFVQTMLGGLEFLHERIVKDSAGQSDTFNNVLDLVSDFNCINKNVTEDSLNQAFLT